MGLARTSSFLLVLCLLTTTHSQAQNPPPQLPMIGDRLGNFWNPRPTNTLRRTLWLPDMPVTSLSATTDRVLVVGSFANFGQSTGGSARLALSDAAVDLSWPRTDGPVYAIVSDGAGGWYLGGNFTLIENLTRRCVAHVLSNGNVDAAFNAQVSGSEVRELLYANGVLYLAGGIGPVGGAARQVLAAVDGQSGAVLSWNPILGPVWSPGSEVYALAIHGDRIYAGGDFEEITQGVLRKHLMLIDRVSGLISTWDPGLNDGIFDMCLDGANLVLGGNFEQILGSPRSKVAVIDAPTGALGGFSTTFSSTVWAVELDLGTLFAGGYFSSAGGQPRNRAAAFDFNSGALLPWNPDVTTPVGGSLVVNDIEVTGSDVVLTGCFTKVGADTREDVALVDRSSGLARPWHSKLAGGTPTRSFCTAIDGSSALIGGDFIIAGSVERNGLCALSFEDDAPTSWNPNVPGTQEALQVGGTVYLAGAIATANGAPREFLAAVDAATGTTTLPFDVSASFPIQTATATALVYGNGMLYAAGNFHTNAGLNSLIAVNPISGALIPGWNANIGGLVSDIALSEDGTKLYVGGQFNVAGIPNQARQNFAVVDAMTGALLPILCNANAPVTVVLPAAGRVIVGGAFLTIGGTNSPLLAQIHPSTGVVYDWTPMVNPGGGFPSVNALSRYGRLIYVGGGFSNVNGVTSPNLGAVDAEFAIMANWSPMPSFVVSSVAAARNRVFVGGAFRRMAGVAMPHFAAFNIQ